MRAVSDPLKAASRSYSDSPPSISKNWVLIQALFSALSSMIAVVALIALTSYVGAVLLTNLFASQFDGGFGHIDRSICTLFQISKEL